MTCSVSFVKSLGIRGFTIGLAGYGIWLFFVAILGLKLKKRSGSRDFNNKRERDLLFLLGWDAGIVREK